MKKIALVTIAVAVVTVLLTFQNCSKTDFSAVEGSLSNSGFSVGTTTVVETRMNVPVDFIIDHTQSIDFQAFDFAPGNGALKGSFQVLDGNNFKLKYTPNFGFRGQDSAIVKVSDKYGGETTFYVIVNVGSALSELEPALAVRGMGCIQCHATVNSNIVTDFGFGSKYFFGTQPADTWWQSGSVYGDHGQNFSTINIPSDKAVIVPKANVPSVVTQATSATTLAQYIKGKLTSSSVASTKSVSVYDKEEVYIGAPTDADMIASTKIGAGERFKYYKNSGDSKDLSGLVDGGTYFKVAGTLVCDGDLVIRGPLLLDGVSLNTTYGCRMYVIGSVFMYGNLAYTSGSQYSNLQISSTRSISLGLGLAQRNGVGCNASDSYSQNASGYGTSSLKNRYATFWTTPGNFVRQNPDPQAFGNSVVAEAAVIEAKEGPLYDAVCRKETRQVGFEHLILNAPIIQSRYEGDFKGTIISEFAIATLGAFKFEFDPIFKTVPVWPFLDHHLYLWIE